MTDITWYSTKDKIKKSLKIIQNIDQSFLKIPITHICTSPKQMRPVLNEELQISPSKIHFNYFRYFDIQKSESIDINCMAVKEMQYSERNYVLRIVLQTEVYLKYFYHQEETDDLFKDTIWFSLNVEDLATHKHIINSLQNNFISLFKISKMSQKLHKEFLELFNNNTMKSDFSVKSNDLKALERDNNKTLLNNSKLRILPALSSSDKDQLCPIFNAFNDVMKSKKRIKRFSSPPKIIMDKKSKISNHKLLYSPTSTHSIEITESDLTCLMSGRYLNDNIINWYLTYIYYEQLSQSQRDQTYFFNIFFNTKLIGTPVQQKNDTPSTRHARVAKWTKNVDIFSKDFIVIPIIEEKHWFFIIICFSWMAGMIDYTELLNKSTIGSVKIPVNKTDFATKTRVNKLEEMIKEQNVHAKPCILLFDSLDYPNKSTKVNIIREYLKSEWDAKRLKTDGPLIFEKNTCRGYSPSIEKQKNGTDCGLYLLQCVECFFRNPLKNYEMNTFKNGFADWFGKRVIIKKRDEIKSIIHKKTKLILPLEEDNDDEDSVTCSNIL